MKIKVPFIVTTPDLKDSESKYLTVEIHIPENMEVRGNIEYSVAIPDHMFKELADSEPQFKTDATVYDKNISGCWAQRTLQRKFRKTQTSVLIEELQDYIYKLTQIIVDRHSIETATMIKKIFISYKHSEIETTNNLNSAYRGKNISHAFKYFTGYEVMTDKFSKLARLDNEFGREIKKTYITKIYYSPKGSTLHHRDTGFQEKEDIFLPILGLNESMESFESTHSIIDWTQEREDFCKRIQNTFIKLGEELDGFLINLNTDKFDELMMGTNFKMLTNG